MINKDITIAEYVCRHAEETPEKAAVMAAGGSLPYHELFQKALQYSVFLQKAGLEKGGIVVTRASNTIEYVVLYLGVHLAGGVICSLEKSTSDNAMIRIAESMHASLLIAEDPQIPAGSCRVVEKDVFAQCAGSALPEGVSFPSPEDSADILFTTGTTGASKGVELSHRALTATAENLIVGCGYEKDMLMVVPGPLNHANAIRKVFTSLINGNTVYLLNGLTSIRPFFDALDQPFPRTACCLPPAMIRLLLTVARDKLSEYKDRLLFIESASAPLPETARNRIIEILPDTRLIINYGSSESASVTMYDCNAHPGLLNCIGKPMPNAKILIVDDQHRPIASSRENMGLIACEGDVNMKGYVNEPALTAEVLQDGILYTNDIGYIDEEGYVYIIGRKGDVINVGGLKVAPAEVEDAALSHPGIRDCICIPVKDPISEHVPKLLYVADEVIPPKELNDFLAHRLESFKLPRRYEKVEKINRTYNGKLDRKSYV